MGFLATSRWQQDKPQASLLPECGKCGLLKTCQSPKMPLYGDGKLGVLVVGEAPGADEDDQGRPFVGRMGQMLRAELQRIDIDLDRDCWTTNALICRPPDNRTPRDREIQYCRPNLLRDLERLNPQMILLLGAIPTKSLIGYLWKDKVDQIGRWVGWQIPSQRLNAWVCPTWHPSYITRLRNDVSMLLWCQHLTAAFKRRSRPWTKGVPDYTKNIKRIYDSQDAIRGIHEMMDSCLDGGSLSFDYETTMLKPDNPDAQIVSCAISNGSSTIAYPMASPVYEATSEFLRSDIPKIAANMKFEERWTRAYFGHRVRRWQWDTMLTAHELDSRKGITSVKFQAFVRFGLGSFDHHIERYLRSDDSNTENRILTEVDIQDLLLYNGFDALLEYKIAQVQMEEMGR